MCDEAPWWEYFVFILPGTRLVRELQKVEINARKWQWSTAILQSINSDTITKTGDIYEGKMEFILKSGMRKKMCLFHNLSSFVERLGCRGALTQPPRFRHGRRKRLPRHDLLGEERWPFLSRGEGLRASLSMGFY